MNEKQQGNANEKQKEYEVLAGIADIVETMKVPKISHRPEYAHPANQAQQGDPCHVISLRRCDDMREIKFGSRIDIYMNVYRAEG
jgi:hypothetical protein